MPLSPSPDRISATLANTLSPPVRRAIRAARAMFERDATAPPPTPDALALIAKAARCSPVPVQARFGFLPSCYRGHTSRNVWAVLSIPTCRAFVPNDREVAIALVLYQLAGGAMRAELVPQKSP